MFSKLYSLLSSKLLHKATEKLLVTAAWCIKSGATISSEVSNSKSAQCESLCFLSGPSGTTRKSLSVFSACGKMNDLSSCSSSQCNLCWFRVAGCTAWVRCRLKNFWPGLLAHVQVWTLWSPLASWWAKGLSAGVVPALWSCPAQPQVLSLPVDVAQSEGAAPKVGCDSASVKRLQILCEWGEAIALITVQRGSYWVPRAAFSPLISPIC